MRRASMRHSFTRSCRRTQEGLRKFRYGDDADVSGIDSPDEDNTENPMEQSLQKACKARAWAFEYQSGSLF